MQELFFVGWVDNLKHCKWSTFLQKERRVLTRKITKMSNYLRYFVVDCVVRINVNKNKLYWCHGYLLVQNADSRLQTGYKI